MKLSLICEANEEKLAFQIIKLIGKAHGTSDFETLRGQVFTAEFLSDRAKIKEDDREAAYKAELLVDAKDGHFKVSDKAFKLAGISGGGGGGGRPGPGFMQQAPGWNKLMSAFGK